MNLWVGIIFLVVSSQLGINARPLPRPINEAIDSFQSNSWEDELRKRNDISPHDNTKILSGKRDINSRGGIDFYEIQRFREPQKFTRGESVPEGSYKGDDFQTSEEDSRSQETEDYDSLEDRPTGEEFEDDHLSEEEQDVDGESALETQSKEQEQHDNHSETEHEREESESTDHYHGSARQKRGMSVDDEDELDDFPFHNVPHYFPAIYTDTAHVKDTAPEHFQSSQQQPVGTENKKAYGDMDDKPGLEEPNSMETYSSEQEEYQVKHIMMEIEQHEALESMGHDHYGSGDDNRRFHGHMRASRESHENTDERNGHETGVAYERNENPEGYNHYTITNRRGEDGDSMSDNGIGLMTRYRTHKEPEYGENGIPDSLTAMKRDESPIMSPGELMDIGDDNEEDNDNKHRAFGGNLEKTKALEWNKDDGDNENSEDNDDVEDDEDDDHKEVTEDDGDKGEVGGDKDEYEFKDLRGNLEETEVSGWDENDEENENREGHEDAIEGDKDGEDESQDETSDWDENEEDDEYFKGMEGNKNIEDYGDNEDDNNDDKEVEREASDHRASRDDLEENAAAAAEWKEGDKGDVEASEGEAKTNVVDTAFDPSVFENKNYELVDDVALARQASQYGYKYSKGEGGSHITEDYEQ